MRSRSLCFACALIAGGLTLFACGELKVADDAGAGQDAAATMADADAPDAASSDAASDSRVPETAFVKVPVGTTTIAGSLSIAADDTGDVSLAWLDTPSAQRHLHITRIAGNEDPPRIIVPSDTPLESNAISLGQAVSTFTTAKGCFGVVWGQAGSLRVAAVGADATPGGSSVFATIGAGPVARLSQVRTAPGAAGEVLVVWSEVARFGADTGSILRAGTLGFGGCMPGIVAIDTLAFGTADVPYQPRPSGAPEVAVTRDLGSFHAAFQKPTTPTILGVDRGTRVGGACNAASASEVDDGGTVTAGGSVGITPNGPDLMVAYYRRTSDTVGDLVVKTLDSAGAPKSETVLERGVLIGMSAATSLEAARLAMATRSSGAIIAAAFARDAVTSELRVYRADKTAPGGFRSQLVDTDVFGPKGGGDAHPLVDVATDGAGRIHLAWRSGSGTRRLTYTRLPP